MSTSIVFLGRTISVPGSYSEVDATGLEQVGLGATGIVAIIGEAEGGRPASTITNVDDLVRINGPQQARDTFRSGDLREASSMIFEPSVDPAILAGAQQVVAVKVNPSTQSTGQLSNAQGAVIDLTSADYGAFTEQISVALANGTNQGKMVTVTFEDDTETGDDLGGANLFTLQYQGAATTWDTAFTNVDLAGRVTTVSSRLESGRDGDVTAWTTPATAEIPANANNAGALVTVYGIDNATGNPAREVLTVDGAATATTAITWTSVTGVTSDLDAVTSAIVVDETGAGAGQLTIAVGTRESGAVIGQGMFVANGRVSVASNGASGAGVQIWGRNAAGQIQGELVTLSGTAAVERITVGDYTQIDAIVLGLVPAAQAVTIIANTVRSDPTVQTNLQRVGDLYNARRVTVDTTGDGIADTTVGFTLTFVTGALTTAITDLDEARNVDVLAPATGGFTADTQAIINYFNSQNTLVNAAQSTITLQEDNITVDTAADSTTYQFEVGNVTVAYTSGTGATVASIQAGLVAAANNTPSVNLTSVASAIAPNIVRLTARSGLGQSVTESDGNLTLSAVTAVGGVQQVPANTTQPLFLQGGAEGTSSFSDWQAAINLLKQVRVNSIVPLTGDPAVHAAAIAHAEFMGGIGRSERDVFLGLSSLSNGVPTNTLPTKTDLKAQVVNLNTRHARAFAQSIDRFNTEGERATFLPWFQATIAAGMQAGSPVGTSLTFKFANVLGFTQNSTWNPVDDSEELIQAGLVFMETVQGTGRRFVRNVTTFLQSNNIAFTEGSVNEAVNFASFEFRTALEIAVGARGFLGTLNSTRGVALNTLSLLVDEGAITTYRSLFLELNVDVLEVSVEIAPIIPINFVRSTIHLVTQQQTA